MTRVNVKIWDTTHKKLTEFSEAKETSLAEVIDKALTRYMGHISDKAEIQQLKAEIARLKNVGASQQNVEPSPMSQHRLESSEALPPKEVVAQETRRAEDAPARSLETAPIPLGASPTLPQALTDTSESLNSGRSSTTPRSDIQSHTPSLAERAQTNPQLKQLLQQCKETQEQQQDTSKLPLPPCIYCAQGYTDQKTSVRFVFCDNPTHKGKSKSSVPQPFTSCQKCYERRQYIKDHPDQFPQRQQEERKYYKTTGRDCYAGQPHVTWGKADGGSGGGHFDYSER